MNYVDPYGRHVPNTIVTYNGERLNGDDTSTTVWEDALTKTWHVEVWMAEKTLLEAMDTWR